MHLSKTEQSKYLMVAALGRHLKSGPIFSSEVSMNELSDTIFVVTAFPALMLLASILYELRQVNKNLKRVIRTNQLPLRHET